jgi:aminoglycoside phosphotransferase (APT) family kinase protein
LESRVASAASQPSGFSPGVAARVRLANGRRVFLKALSPAQNEEAVAFHRREARIVAALPAAAPVPRLLWLLDDEAGSGWIVLVFEDIEGRHPAQPWRADELDRVLGAMEELAATLTPSPLPPGSVASGAEKFDLLFNGWRELRSEHGELIGQLDSWSAQHLASLAAIEENVAAAVEGNTLLHSDVRADNLLLTDDRVWFVDWPHACTGAAWMDAVLMAPSVAMQGGPAPEELLERYSPARAAEPEAITAAVVAVAGFLTHHALLPAPPGLPTLRAFQAAQGMVAREWAATRLDLA